MTIWTHFFTILSAHIVNNEQKNVQSAQLCLVYVYGGVYVCVTTCPSSSFSGWLVFIRISSLFYIYFLSPKFNKQSKTRALERKWKQRLTKNIICWVLLSSRIARRAPISVNTTLWGRASFVYWKYRPRIRYLSIQVGESVYVGWAVTMKLNWESLPASKRELNEFVKLL